MYNFPETQGLDVNFWMAVPLTNEVRIPLVADPCRRNVVSSLDESQWFSQGTLFPPPSLSWLPRYKWMILGWCIKLHYSTPLFLVGHIINWSNILRYIVLTLPFYLLTNQNIIYIYFTYQSNTPKHLVDSWRLSLVIQDHYICWCKSDFQLYCLHSVKLPNLYLHVETNE